MTVAVASFAVQPGGSEDYYTNFAHAIAGRNEYQIYMGGCDAHLRFPTVYNIQTTFAGKEGCYIRKVESLPPPGSLLVMRARDTKEFYVGRVTGPAVEHILPESDSLPWDWEFRRPKHKVGSLAARETTVAAGLPVEDYIVTIPVTWEKVSEPTEAQLASYGSVRRKTLQRMSTPWPLAG
jgi:hypothetical protein